jgi:sterol desaturase/sphingolipid hydroxylase (fatty acid hydroxylase superfamily)
MSSLQLALHFAIGFPLGLLVANAGEWVIHNRVLHQMARRKGSFWAYHWFDHHNEARRNEMHDAAYDATWMAGGWNPRTKEVASLAVGSIPWILLLPVIPGFATAALFSTVYYYYVHKRSHVDPEWARKHLPWHYDHHMGANQDANWCVTFPWFDILMGTREPYVGTEREAADREKRERRAARSSEPGSDAIGDARPAGGDSELVQRATT